MKVLIIVISLLAGLIPAMGFLPQLIELIRTKNAEAYKPLWYLVFYTVSTAAYMAYAAYYIKAAPALFIGAAISLCTVSAVLILCLILKSRSKKND